MNKKSNKLPLRNPLEIFCGTTYCLILGFRGVSYKRIGVSVIETKTEDQPFFSTVINDVHLVIIFFDRSYKHLTRPGLTD